MLFGPAKFLCEIVKRLEYLVYPTKNLSLSVTVYGQSSGPPDSPVIHEMACKIFSPYH